MNNSEKSRLLSINEAVKIMGIGRTKIYQEINEGRLDARKFGSRTLINVIAIETWIENLPHYSAS